MAEEKYFEIPVSIIDDNGDLTEIKTYISKGDEDSVRLRAAKALEKEFSDKDYDYDVIEISPDEYETFESVEYLPGDSEISEDSEVNEIGEVGSPREMEDEMEDLQDRYYALQDKLNSLPAEDLDQDKIEKVNMEMNKAKDYFDQYDFFKCTEALNNADQLISELSKDYE